MEIKREKAITDNRRFSTISFNIIIVLFLVFFFHTHKHSSGIIQQKNMYNIHAHESIVD